MDATERADALLRAVQLITQLQHKEAEKLLQPLAAEQDVAVLTLMAEMAWLRAMISEDKDDLKEAHSRLEAAEAQALKGCDSQRGTLLGSLYKLASWQSTKFRGEFSKERLQEVSNCTNLAYVYLMQALAGFRGSTKNYISGAFKLKAAWRLYKQLWENEVLAECSTPSPSNSSTPSSSWRELVWEMRTSKAGNTPASTPRTKRRIQTEAVLESLSQSPGDAAVSGNDAAELSNRFSFKISEKKDGMDVGSHLPPSVVADICYGLGGFHFFVSMVPTGFKWIVESLGFRGDREAGKRELQECVAKGGHRQASALLLLLWMDTFFYKERKKAEQLLLQASSMLEDGGKSPSPLFRYMGGYLARVQGHLDVAVSRFACAMESSTESRLLQLMCLYEMGWCHYLRCDFPTAIEHYEPFMREFKAPSYRAYCAYQLGCALDLTGRTAEARPYMASVHKLVRKNFTFDQYAARKAAQWLKLGKLSPFERTIIFPMNHMEAKKPALGLMALENARKTLTQKTLRSLTIALPSRECISTAIGKGGREVGVGEGEEAPSEDCMTELVVDEVLISDDSSAVYCYLLGRGLRGISRFTEAIECFQRVVEKEALIKEEVYILPYTYCEIGELLMREERFEEAWVNLRIAKTRFQNFDFDKPLGRRLKLALDTLKGKKK